MDCTLEREVKLDASKRFSLARLQPDLDGFSAAPPQFHRLHTIYYDTEDLRLARWNCSLRLRLPDTWTLKLPGPSSARGLSREEHVGKRAGGEVPPELLDLATSYVRGAAVGPVAELRTIRVTRNVRSPGGDELAEIAEDDVRVVAGSKVLKRFRQVEIELLGAAPDDALKKLTSILREKGAGSPNATPKYVLALGSRARELEISEPKMRASPSGGEVARAAFVESVRRLIRCDAELRTAPGAESVHDARVAVRRLRSDLRSFRPILDRFWSDDLRGELKWLSDGLSAARDGDVVVQRLERDAGSLPAADRAELEVALAPVRERRDEAYRRLEVMLHDERYLKLLDRVVGAAERPAFNRRAARRASRMSEPIMRKAWKPARKAVKALREPPADRDLHRVRIKAKGVRYAAEALAPAIGKRASRFAALVEELQTLLGEQHDAVNACDVLRTRVGGSRDAFVAGELAALERAADEGRSAWRPVWKRAARKRVRFWRRR